MIGQPVSPNDKLIRETDIHRYYKCEWCEYAVSKRTDLITVSDKITWTRKEAELSWSKESHAAKKVFQGEVVKVEMPIDKIVKVVSKNEPQKPIAPIMPNKPKAKEKYDVKVDYSMELF